MAKKNNIHLDPIMALSMMAIFALMPLAFTISNSSLSKTSASKASAAEPVMVATPTPSPTPKAMY